MSYHQIYFVDITRSYLRFIGAKSTVSESKTKILFLISDLTI